jgi:hypothetical protein
MDSIVRRRLPLREELDNAQSYYRADQAILVQQQGRQARWGKASKLMSILGAASIFLWFTLGYNPEVVIEPTDYKSRADRILKTSPLIDGHNDLPYLLRIELKNKIYDTDKFTFRKRGPPPLSLQATHEY